MLISIVPLGFPPVDLDFSGLAFISEKCKPPDKDDTDREFKNISKISSMFRNYNFLLAKWGKRNELTRIAVEKIKPYYEGQGSTGTISLKKLVAVLGGAEIAVLIQETEEVLSRTDHILKELLDFQEFFPVIAQNAIPKTWFSKIKEAISRRPEPYQYVLRTRYKKKTTDFALEKSPVDQELFVKCTSIQSAQQDAL